VAATGGADLIDECYQVVVGGWIIEGLAALWLEIARSALTRGSQRRATVTLNMGVMGASRQAESARSEFYGVAREGILQTLVRSGLCKRSLIGRLA
jgi:hypothetical protein